MAAKIAAVAASKLVTSFTDFASSALVDPRCADLDRLYN
jgi:hypothetical protein